MMERSERAATEDDPLKTGEDGLEAGPTPPPGAELKAKKERRRSCKEVLAFVRANHWRTAVFFFSLFLCLTIVFAFSFILPCPVRPQYLVSWNRTFPGAATYDFLTVKVTGDDKVKDAVFAVRSNGISSSCSDTGLVSPCVSVMAVDGTDGRTLWEHQLDAELHWAQCELQTRFCLLFHSDIITALDANTVVWQLPRPPVLSGSLSVLSLPDLDKDGVGDVALIGSDRTGTKLNLLSGKTGVQIGSTVTLDPSEMQAPLLQRTPKGSHYVLLLRDDGLYGLALWRIATNAKAGLESVLKKDQNWDKGASPTSGLVPIYMSRSLRHVLRTDESSDRSNLLMVSEREVALVDGQSLDHLWRVNTSRVLSEPFFGHYNKDGQLDVIMEEDSGNFTKRVLILDGGTGLLLWEVSLWNPPKAPRPAAIHTTNFVSVFIFWGAMNKEENVTSPSIRDQRRYMMHPLHDKVLLESANDVENIVAFKATLLEHGRHAAYLLLTGPAHPSPEGVVMLKKRKMKQDVPDSKVQLIGDAAPPLVDIREVFERLRFSDN